MPDINMQVFEEAKRNQLVTEVDIQTQVELEDYQVQLADIANPTQSQDNAVIDRHGEFLPHWNESLDFDTWVKMSMEVAGKQILMLRGDSSVDGVSDGDDTFEFFDDFMDDTKTEAVTFGVFSSVEYGIQTSDKLVAAVSAYNSWNPDFVVDLGDIIDYDGGAGGGNSTLSLADLDTIEAVYDDLTMSRYYVFGNHDLDYISKTEFMNHTGKSEKYHSFDIGDYHFIILDACFTNVGGTDYDSGNFNWQDAYIPTAEKTWLTNDLANTTKKTFIFVEQHLAGEIADLMINNAPDVRTILENSGKVLAVFHGHSGVNKKTTLNSIDYYALRAMDMASTNAYSKVRVYTDNSIWIEGIDEQTSYGSDGTYDITSKWSNVGSPVITVLDGKLTVDGDQSTTWEGINSIHTFNAGIIEYIVDAIGAQTCVGTIEPTVSGVGRDGVLALFAAPNDIRYYISNTGYTYDDDYPAFPFNLKIVHTGSNAIIHYNGIQQETRAFTATGLHATLDSYELADVQVSNVFIRKYTATEPVHTISTLKNISTALKLIGRSG